MNFTPVRIPRVSVVMPIHDGERFLREAIDSILGQTFTDFELLVVDDGSTDRTAIILQEAAARDSRVTVIRQERRGIPRARNRGIGGARGMYVAVHDADDVSLPARLAKQVDFLDRHPEAAMVGSTAQWIDPRGAPLPTMAYPITDEDIRAKLHVQSCFVHGSVMFRRSCLLAVGGYREEFPLAEDVDLFFRLAERYEVANLPEVLYHWRRSDSSVSLRRTSLLQKYFLVAVELAKQRRTEGRDLLMTGTGQN